MSGGRTAAWALLNDYMVRAENQDLIVEMEVTWYAVFLQLSR